MKKKQRRNFIMLIIACLSVAVALSLYALQDNVAFFFTSSDITRLEQQQSPQVAMGRVFRLGGMVVKNSVRKRNKDLAIKFTVTDGAEETKVEYKGLLPDLFREGQGVVAKGALNDRGVFIATELLAKHDEKYMPPEIAKKMKAAR